MSAPPSQAPTAASDAAAAPTAPTPPDGGDASDATPRQPRSSISTFLFLSLLFYLVTNNSAPDDWALRERYRSALTSLEWQAGNLSAWLNGTDPASLNFSLPVLPEAQTQLVTSLQPPGVVLDPATHSYFPNITGFIRGSSAVYNLSEPGDAEWATYGQALMESANATVVAEKLGRWNWTAVQRVAVSVLEKSIEVDDDDAEMRKIVDESEGIMPVQGHIELIDGETEEEMRLDMSGVHFIANGSFYALAEPVGSAIDIRTLPALLPSAVQNSTARALLPILRARIRAIRALVLSASPSSSTADSDFDPNGGAPASTCPFFVYGQIAPTNASEAQMAELEEETMEPTGASVVRRPPLLVDFVLLSTECGVLVRIEKAEGLRSRLFFRKVTTYAGFAAVVYLALLLLLTRETRSRTPAALARISRWTFLAQIVADSIAFAGHITFAILADGRPSLSLVAPAFLSSLLFSHEVQFAMLIYQVQAPEDAAVVPTAGQSGWLGAWVARFSRREEGGTQAQMPQETAGDDARVPLLSNATEAESASHSDNTREGTTQNGSESNTLPANAPATTQPPSPPPAERYPNLRRFWTILRNDHQARTWLLISLLLFFVMRVILAPSLAMLVFAGLYLAIWTPQILRATLRARTCALSTEYMLGTTCGRLAIGMYFVACPKNVLDIAPRKWMYTLALVMFAQVGFIMLQNTLGPAFFLPGSYATSTAYDYHPPLPPPTADPEAHAPPSLGDCAICMDTIPYDMHGDDLREKQGADGELRRRSWISRFAGPAAASTGRRKIYSLSPCHHLFHTECLDKWLAIKNICPQCRRPLPPL